MTYAEIANGIRDADYNQSGIRCLQLFQLDIQFFEKLREEVLELCYRNEPSDVTQRGHITKWAKPYGEALQFSLLNKSGFYNDTSTDHNQSCLGKRFHQRQKYPNLVRFIEFFPHCVNFRLNVMGAQSGLSPHKEHVTVRMRSGKVGIKARFHLPVITNSLAEVMLDGYIYHLRERIVYLFNNGCIHSAKNEGSSARLHLVWDMLLTREALDLMFGDEAVTHFPMRRIQGVGRKVTRRRYERVGSYESIPRVVDESEARTISLFIVQ
jgi:Aspartyl/Asparaginyl beta-hydroxylase